MRAISRRLGRLEYRFGAAVESVFTRQLAARIEEGRRRVAEWRAGEGLAPEEPKEEDLSGLTIVEILHRGCGGKAWLILGADENGRRRTRSR
jgi:hypothetical protein